MPIGIRVSQPVRRRAAAALAAVAVAAVGLTIALDQNAAAAAPATAARSVVQAAAAPVTTTAGGVSLTVDPAGGLTSAGATLKVTGRGFNPAGGLYVAICHADGKAPASLQDCVGGAIPTSNTSNSWAHITPAAAGTGTTGPVVATWGTNGSFSVSLTLPASNSASDALDCSQVACALYTRPDAGNDPSQVLSVPLAYAAAATSSTPSSSPPSSSTASSSAPTTSSRATVSSQPVVTSTIADVPTTVEPKTIRSASVRAGGSQEVLFAGFAKGELVLVRLDSTALPAVRADSDGVVKVDFVVPASTPAGTHLLRVSGQTSRTTGVASFLVTAAPVVKTTPSSAPSSSVALSSSPVSSSAPVSSAVIVPPASSAPLSSSSPAPVSSSAAPVVAPASSTSGSKPVWPWYVLGLVVLLWAGFAIFMLQRRRSRLAAEMREKERILAEGAAAEQHRAADAIARANADAPTAYLGPLPTEEPGGYTGYHPGEHGLLSGRDNPENPGLLSGQQYRPDTTGDQPTTYLPPGGSGASTPGWPPVAPDSAGPPTGAWSPDFTGGPPPSAPSDGGPGTAQWRPDFGDDQGPSAGTGPGAAGAGTQQTGPDVGPAAEESGEDGPEATPGGRHSR